MGWKRNLLLDVFISIRCVRVGEIEKRIFGSVWRIVDVDRNESDTFSMSLDINPRLTI